MADRVTRTKLASEARNNVEALINDKTKVADPTKASAENRKWIYSRHPDVKAGDFSGYPYIVISPSSPSIPVTGSLDGKSKMVIWDIMVDVVTSDRGYGGKDAQGLSHMDAISDDILETFLNKTNRTTLSNNSMKFADVATTDVVPEARHNELTFNRTFLLSFKSRIQVSS